MSKTTVRKLIMWKKRKDVLDQEIQKIKEFLIFDYGIKEDIVNKEIQKIEELFKDIEYNYEPVLFPSYIEIPNYDKFISETHIENIYNLICKKQRYMEKEFYFQQGLIHDNYGAGEKEELLLGNAYLLDLVLRSNYFLPSKKIQNYTFNYDTNTIKNRLYQKEHLTIFNRKEEYKSSLGYVGERGTIWDLKVFIFIFKNIHEARQYSIFSKDEIYKAFNVPLKNKAYLDKVLHSISKLLDTTFKYKGHIFSLIDRAYFEGENTWKSDHFVLLPDALFEVNWLDNLDYIDRIDLNIINKLSPNNSAIRFYTLLSCFENEMCFSYNGIKELFFPKTTLKTKMSIANFKRRTLNPLYDIGFLNEQKVKQDSKNKMFVFEKGAVKKQKIKV